MMASTIGRTVGVLLSVGWICSACSGKSTNTGTKPSNSSFCDPGIERCDGDDIKRCDEAGFDETVVQTCPRGQCRERNNDASCGMPSMPSMPIPCAASLAVCNGSLATTCKADGSGPEPGGVDCADSKKHCVRGECSDTHCEPNTKSCLNGDVYLCASDGLSQAVWDYCSETERCDDASGTCLGSVCIPGEFSCSGTRVSTCDGLGSKWLPSTTDCATQGKVCLNGSCEKPTCTASTTFCRGNDLLQCDPTGARSTLSRTCRPGIEHCELTPAGLYAFCVLDACVAGEKVCVGNEIKTCNANGSLPAVGTACSNEEFCENATCKPLGCVPGALSCKDKNIYNCEPNGPMLYTECSAGEACLALVGNADLPPEFNPNVVTCMPLSCPPGQTGCFLNKLGTCAADGASLSEVTNDCAASSQVCTTTGTCAASVTDTVGLDKFAVTNSDGPYIGNLLEVHSSRKLTELQTWIAFASPRDLRWIVYEQVGNDLILRAEKTTTIASSVGFVGSGPLSFNYTLEAGKRYALGVVTPGESIGYADSGAPLPLSESPSFGALLGAVYAYAEFSKLSITSNFSVHNVSLMKVTTEFP
ncbi:MAG TPA: hypothetical protein VJV79_34690 [Polyangiaceae bacterium]|nr:hypothetical protein [Polyangiaceae bacterium]